MFAFLANNVECPFMTTSQCNKSKHVYVINIEIHNKLLPSMYPSLQPTMIFFFLFKCCSPLTCIWHITPTWFFCNQIASWCTLLLGWIILVDYYYFDLNVFMEMIFCIDCLIFHRKCNFWSLFGCDTYLINAYQLWFVRLVFLYIGDPFFCLLWHIHYLRLSNLRTMLHVLLQCNTWFFVHGVFLIWSGF